MVESTFKTFPHMQFFMLYTMVMPKMPKYALKRSFVNVFLLICLSFFVFLMILYTCFRKKTFVYEWFWMLCHMVFGSCTIIYEFCMI